MWRLIAFKPLMTGLLTNPSWALWSCWGWEVQPGPSDRLGWNILQSTSVTSPANLPRICVSTSFYSCCSKTSSPCRTLLLGTTLQSSIMGHFHLQNFSVDARSFCVGHLLQNQSYFVGRLAQLLSLGLGPSKLSSPGILMGTLLSSGLPQRSFSC